MHVYMGIHIMPPHANYSIIFIIMCIQKLHVCVETFNHAFRLILYSPAAANLAVPVNVATLGSLERWIP